jgi:hypothetical protein
MSDQENANAQPDISEEEKQKGAAMYGVAIGAIALLNRELYEAGVPAGIVSAALAISIADLTAGLMVAQGQGVVETCALLNRIATDMTERVITAHAHYTQQKAEYDAKAAIHAAAAPQAANEASA